MPDIAPQLPHNIDAERCVLGAILLDNSALDFAAQKLFAEDFFLQQHAVIYRQLLALADKSVSMDLVTLCDALGVAGQLEAAGGAAYLAQLVDGVPRVSHLPHYAEIIREKALLRQIVHAAQAIGQTAIEGETDALSVLDQAEASIAQLSDRRAITELQPLREVIDENLEDLQRILTEPRGISGLATQYLQLDTLLCGLQPGNVIILAARPSIGKTALALNIAENVVSKGDPTAMFSLEMTRREILQRLLASIARRDLRKLRAGGMPQSEWKQLTGTLAGMAALPLYIDDANPTTVTEMAAKARYIQRRKRLKLVIVDYLQLVSGPRRGFTNRNEEVGASSRALKAMARGLNVPVIVLSQLTRASEREERRPQLSDLRESGAIEQDADVVLFIHRPKAFAVGEPAAERNKTELIVAKQRNGPTAVVHFAFLAPYTRFEELSPTMFEGEA